MSNLTQTTNKLHFEDLDSHRFEDLAYEILYRKQEWYRIENWGRSGADDGIDIYCEEQNGQKWFGQCKRYKSLSLIQIKSVVDKIVSNNKNTNDSTILIVTACDVSKTTSDSFQNYSIKNGFKRAMIWTSSTLEAELFNKHKDLLNKYFGHSCNDEQKEKRIHICHKMRKEVEEKLLSHKAIYNPQYSQKIIEDPSLKFIYDAAIIHSIDDESYPDVNEKDPSISGWFKSWFYDLTIEGLEILPVPHINAKVAVNRINRLWRKLNEDESPSENETILNADYIGVIPFYNIILINEEGDKYFSEPHIYCRFAFDGHPYSKRYLKNRRLKIDFIEGEPVDVYGFARLLQKEGKTNMECKRNVE